MGNWRERSRSKRDIASLAMLREILNAPTLKSKREVVAQYNPMHYIFGYELLSSSPYEEGEHCGLSQ